MLQERPGIDHLVIGGRDLAALGAGFEAMGFTLTPTAHHPFGTGNRLAILDGNFIEFLGITAPEKIPAPTAEGFSLGGHLTDFLARSEGLAFVVLSSEDAHGDQRRFAEAGIATLPPVDFSRAAGQPGGGEATVSFSIAFALPPVVADAPHFVCQQHAPEHFWHPEFQDHANGARSITEVTLVADDPAALAPFYAELVTPNAVHGEGRRLLVETQRGRITVLPAVELAGRFPGLDLGAIPSAPRPAIVAIAIGCDDPGRVAACLAAGGIAHDRVEGTVRVGAAAAFGAILEFHPEG